MEEQSGWILEHYKHGPEYNPDCSYCKYNKKPTAYKELTPEKIEAFMKDLMYQVPPKPPSYPVESYKFYIMDMSEDPIKPKYDII